MQVFYTPQADAYLAAMSTLLAFSGLLGMVLAGYYRDDDSKRLVRAAARGVLLLAVAMWLAIYSVPEAGTGVYIVCVAIVFLFAEASIFQAILLTGRSRRLLLSLIAATFILSAAFAYWQWLRPGDPAMAFPALAIGFAKSSLFLSTLWLSFFLPAITPAGRQMRAAWYLFTLYALLVLLSPYPSLPGPDAAHPQWWNRFFLVIYQLRLVSALAAAVLVWRSYAVITELGSKLRRLLAAMLLTLALLSVFVVVHALYPLQPLRGDDGGLVGSAAPMAAAIFRHRRPLVLALPLVVVGFILLLGGQRTVWQRAYAAGRDEALKLGALGHDLAGVCITDAENVVTEVNQRLCDIVQSRREMLVGRLIYEAFPSRSSEAGLTPEQILHGLRVHGRLHYETELSLSGGGTVHAMVLVRRLEGESAPGRAIWECVDITPQKELELQLRRQLENCRTGAGTEAVAATDLDRR